jgi:hypothetical protein
MLDWPERMNKCLPETSALRRPNPVIIAVIIIKKLFI